MFSAVSAGCRRSLSILRLKRQILLREFPGTPHHRFSPVFINCFPPDIIHPSISRNFSTQNIRFSTVPSSQRIPDVNASVYWKVSDVLPYELVEEDLRTIYREIKTELNCDLPELVELAQYYFSAHGKAFRPMIVLLMAATCAKHCGGLAESEAKKQRKVAVIAEMIHTASLIHDDVIDEAETRRNQPSLHKIWGEKKAILTGDYILSIASRELARLRNPDVIICLAQVIEDLVKGELMQIGSKDSAVRGRLATYLDKTYYKTASLMANSCKAVAMLSGCPQDIIDRCYLFGKNLGMAFQIIDDNLDFISTFDEMGKPTSVDLKLGLATAPVLLAAKQAPELNILIDRRFKNPDDVMLARKAVFENNGIEQSRHLAETYIQKALSQLSSLSPCVEREALVKIAELVINRTK